MSDIFKEVEEDIRRERYVKLWKGYGKYVIAGAVAIVLGTAAGVGWRDYKSAQREGESAALFQALELDRAGAKAEAVQAFAVLGRSAGSGYATLALFHQAAALAQAGDPRGAVKVYDSLSSDSGLDGILRDLAAFYAALHLVNVANAEEFDRRLDPLLGDTNPWRHSARELKALNLQNVGRTEEARGFYEQLASDPNTPRGVRTRASDLLLGLRGKD